MRKRALIQRLHSTALALSLVLPASLAAAVCQPGLDSGEIFSVGANMGMCALVDLDADGHLDLTTGRSIFLGDGRGGISRNAIRLNDMPSWDLGASDFDGDGRIDVVLIGQKVIDDGAATFLFGQPEARPGAPRFGDEVMVTAIQGAWHLAIADLLEDGRSDVVAVARGQRSLAVLLNKGNRSFQRQLVSGLRSGGHSLAVGDYDGDGHKDIAAGEGSDATVFFGKGDGAFPKSISGTLYVPPDRLSAHRFRAADLDGDGRSELLAIGDDSVVIYLGRTLAPGGSFPAVAHRVLSIRGAGRFLEVVDANSDGALDVVTQTNDGMRAVIQVFGQVENPGGALSFEAGPVHRTSLSGRGAVLAVGDLDEDGAPDIVLTTEDTQSGQVFLNDGSCLLRAKPGDANADGQLDLADPIAILSHMLAEKPLACPEAAELNGDGQLDLADPIYLLNHLFASGPPPAGTEAVVCYGVGI